MSEADIQALIHAHPSSLPIAEIDSMFANPVPICTELNTSAGPIDNFMVTTSGLPVLVECKLWRNPEGRREVVGQILDYAKELSRWSSSDLQREVSRRLNRDGNALLELVRAVEPSVDEMQFNDALTANLRRGRFLLLIVGDGIREGVEAIAEYLQVHAGLHFSLGLVELPIFVMPDGSRLVVPRVLARTMIATRNVVALPDGYMIAESKIPYQNRRSTQNVAPCRSCSSSSGRNFLPTSSSTTLNSPSQNLRAKATSHYPFQLRMAAVGSRFTETCDKTKSGFSSRPHATAPANSQCRQLSTIGML